MITLIYLAAAILGLILAFMPWLIYNELKRQGEARREEALKIISLLSSLANRPTDAQRSAEESARLQAIIDTRNAKGGPE